MVSEVKSKKEKEGHVVRRLGVWRDRRRQREPMQGPWVACFTVGGQLRAELEKYTKRQPDQLHGAGTRG